MNVEISPIGYQEKAVLRNLMQLYLYDFSEMDGSDLNSLGLYEYRYLDHYWTDPGRFPFFVRVDGRLAGFALLRRGSYFSADDSPDPGAGMIVSEFFILRKYRRLGVGSALARDLFRRYPGRWEIAQTPENLAALSFWRQVIAAFTAGNFEEVFLDNQNWQGPVQVLESS